MSSFENKPKIERSKLLPDILENPLMLVNPEITRE